MPQQPEKDVELRTTRHFDRANNVIQMPTRPTSGLEVQLPDRLRIVIDSGTAVLDVPLKNYMVVGRRDNSDDRQVDIDLTGFDGQHNGVSRYHAIIHIHNERISIKDFNSTNGTFLNGFSLKPMFGYRLRDGDQLMMGRLRMRVYFLYQGE